MSDDPYAAPSTSADPIVDADRALEGANIDTIVVVAGLALLATGIVTAASAGQLLAIFHFWPRWLVVFPWIFLVSGMGAIGASGMLMQVRPGSIPASLALGVVLSVGQGLWVLYALFHGAFTLVSLMGAGFGMLALLLLALAVGPARRAQRARQALGAF